MSNTVGGGLDGIPMTPQGDSMGGMQDAIMSFGQRQLEEERLKRLFAGAGGSTLTPGLAGSVGGGGFTSLRGGTGPTGMGWVPPAR